VTFGPLVVHVTALQETQPSTSETLRAGLQCDFRQAWYSVVGVDLTTLQQTAALLLSQFRSIVAPRMSNRRSRSLDYALSGHKHMKTTRDSETNRLHSAWSSFGARPWTAMVRRHCCSGGGGGRASFPNDTCQGQPWTQYKGI